MNAIISRRSAKCAVRTYRTGPACTTSLTRPVVDQIKRRKHHRLEQFHKYIFVLRVYKSNYKLVCNFSSRRQAGVYRPPADTAALLGADLCGINGIFAYGDAAPVERAELLRTRDHMTARGPDGFGEWMSDDGRLELAHRRLSIIDLSDAASQPMSTLDGSCVVTFNGEIYNHRDLRRSLEARGYVFQTNSDTEVLLHLYEDRGADMVHELRGMFAFAIWDSKARELFLARDPYGIKPLYYADDGKTFRFASQVKALMAGGAISSEVDPAGIVGFYLWGSVPEPFTIRRDIKSLPAGSTLRIRAGEQQRPVRYHSIAETFCKAETERRSPIGAKSSVDYIREALLDSVRYHLIAAGPVGIFLSSGIDSAALLGLMRDTGQKNIQSVTLTFGEFLGTPQDEAPLAEMIARECGARHTTRVVTREEFETDLPRILDAMDQPTIDGINTWFVAKAASELGLKAAISGVGGDELFAGYPSFRDLPRWVGWMSAPSRVPGLGRAARSLMSFLAPYLGLNPKSASMLELGGDYAGAYMLRRGLFMPWELGQTLGLDLAKEGLERLAPLGYIRDLMSPEPRSISARISTLESAMYMRNQLLRDTDWASMAHSLEIRLPLVDTVLLGELAPYSSTKPLELTKRALAASPSSKLPHELVRRRKTGFGVPIPEWIKNSTKVDPQRNVLPPRSANGAWPRNWAMTIGSSVLQHSSLRAK